MQYVSIFVVVLKVEGGEFLDYGAQHGQTWLQPTNLDSTTKDTKVNEHLQWHFCLIILSMVYVIFSLLSSALP